MVATKFIRSDYVELGIAQALYDKLEDGTFAGRMPSCKGVIAFGATLRDCEDELRSTLEDWIVVGLKLNLRNRVSPRRISQGSKLQSETRFLLTVGTPM